MTDTESGRRANLVGLETTINPDNFLISATDDKGHGVKVYFRSPPSLLQQIENMLASRCFPYRNKGELIRHALVRHMYYLRSISSSPIPSVMEQTEIIMEMCRQEDFASSFRQTLAKVAETVNAFMAQGDTGQARKMVLRVQRQINQMPEGYWRDKYLKQLEINHGDLLKHAPRASLSPDKADEE